MSKYKVLRRDCTIKVQEFGTIPAIEVFAFIIDKGKILDEAHYFDVIHGPYFMIFHPGEIEQAWYHYSQISPK